MIDLTIFDSMSGFISTVVIAGAAVVVTYIYNINQLKISTNEDLVKLVPKLGSKDINTRKWGAISLSLYGKDAVPPLIAMLDDNDKNVQQAASTALSIIGKHAIPELMETVRHKKKNSTTKRGWAIYTLGFMHATKAYNLIISELDSNDKELPESAATALGYLKKKNSVKKLLSILNRSIGKNHILTKNIVWALGEIPGAQIPDDLICRVIDDLIVLLKDENKDIRYETLWLFRENTCIRYRCKEKVLKSLNEVLKSEDNSDEVRKLAGEIIHGWDPQVN